MFTLDSKRTYHAMIKNSVGSNLFRNLYVTKNDTTEDMLEDGNLSCAFFVSTILHHFNFIKASHATVSGLICDLEKSGWVTTNNPQRGDVLIWEKQMQVRGDLHAHTGFYISEEEAISNSDVLKTPVSHHPTFGTTQKGIPVRKIEAIYTRNDY